MEKNLKLANKDLTETINISAPKSVFMSIIRQTKTILALGVRFVSGVEKNLTFGNKDLKNTTNISAPKSVFTSIIRQKKVLLIRKINTIIAIIAEKQSIRKMKKDGIVKL